MQKKGKFKKQPVKCIVANYTSCLADLADPDEYSQSIAKEYLFKNFDLTEDSSKG